MIQWGDTRRMPLRGSDRRTVVAWALVSTEDYGVLSAFRWYRSSEGYARRSEGGRKVYMHRELLGLQPGDGLFGDHINGDRLDNRRENLRVVTRAQQQQNVPGQRGKSSEHRGVHWRKDIGRWNVQVRVNGTVHNLGVFDDEAEAAHVAAAFRERHMPFSVVGR